MINHKAKEISLVLKILIIVTLLVLAGCGSNDAAAKPGNSAANNDTVVSSEPASGPDDVENPAPDIRKGKIIHKELVPEGAKTFRFKVIFESIYEGDARGWLATNTTTGTEHLLFESIIPEDIMLEMGKTFMFYCTDMGEETSRSFVYGVEQLD
ncbi:MAG: hypothetical protein LBG75_00410 [Candidatus Nomurabacteria bacterium]|jgi:hypothetical protein|nr:hypothetical protein [Candidatus Nomurabacteria bacterium]